MSNQMAMYILGIAGGLFVLVIIAYIIIKKMSSNSSSAKLRALKQGTESSGYNSDVMYQKIYLMLMKTPILRRYTTKLRRRLEIINIDDEYVTRRQTAKIMLKGTIAVFVFLIGILMLTSSNKLLMVILLGFLFFIVDALMSGMVDKLDTKLLKQQIEFFAAIRHAYHEYNMVEEAIYEVSQNDELEISRQGEKIYEILISDDPETELEKYYDVAPNSYLKEFAGVSYLTREFGDRKDKDGASLYLKNLNNITEEMQLEILKREKLDYVFQSLSVIAIAPILAMEPLKNWAVTNFSFTSQFYDGKIGFIAQIAIVILTFICYILTRKLKENSSMKKDYGDPNKVWQMKIYNNPVLKPIIDMFIPKKGTREYKSNINLLKDAASKQKIETFYVNRIFYAIITFILSLFLFGQIHNIAVTYIYENPTSGYDMLGGLSDKEEAKAMTLTEQDNLILDKLKGKSIKKEEIADTIRKEVKVAEYYKDATQEEIDEAVTRLEEKLGIVNKENLRWFEWLIAFAFAIGGYFGPYFLLIFQKTMRKLEIENEVMQFQTIILMLMKIERVNVELILEWLERYANIFKEPIARCVNNYEAGAWEALEELKNDVRSEQLIQIVEGLQSSVEKIPIKEAFDELDNEREYYQEKKKEANERLIKRKGMIGKAIGFTPMVVLFVGYLIIPLVGIGMLSMTTTMSSMSTMQ